LPSVRHELAHMGGHGVGIDDILDPGTRLLARARRVDKRCRRSRRNPGPSYRIPGSAEADRELKPP
jgi:hypothetical protein